MIVSVNKQGITVLTPAKGMYLVKGDAYTSGVVYLGKMDKAENWTETAEKPPDPVPFKTVEEELVAVRAENETLKKSI